MTGQLSWRTGHELPKKHWALLLLLLLLMMMMMMTMKVLTARNAPQAAASRSETAGWCWQSRDRCVNVDWRFLSSDHHQLRWVRRNWHRRLIAHWHACAKRTLQHSAHMIIFIYQHSHTYRKHFNTLRHQEHTLHPPPEMPNSLAWKCPNEPAPCTIMVHGLDGASTGESRVRLREACTASSVSAIWAASSARVTASVQ